MRRWHEGVAAAVSSRSIQDVETFVGVHYREVMLPSVLKKGSIRLRNVETPRAQHDGDTPPASSPQQPQQQSSKPSAVASTVFFASLYVLSGVTQPLLMTLAREAGLADPSAQTMMFFYYLGPASVMLLLLVRKDTVWPSQKALRKALLIACCDLVSQTMNYTGSSFAGPTLFAIIYSSVAVWTAVFSRVLLKRRLTTYQWIGVFVVSVGLAVTGFDSVSMGQQIWSGSCLITVGSMMNALTYVLSESILTNKGTETLSVQVNCAVQSSVGYFVLLVWQIVYTRPRFNALIQIPMQQVNTTTLQAACILIAFAVANFIHYMTFFYTLKHFRGGATSAGVMKALQAVLVFVVTSVAYCGRVGGVEMCFSTVKLASLVVVVGGVVLFGRATAKAGSSSMTSREYTKKESSEGDLHP